MARSFLPLLSILDRHGNVVSESRNLRGIRAAVGRQHVKLVSIQHRPDQQGELYIEFDNGNHFTTDFADFSVLKDAVRNWRNLYGARLQVDWKNVGKVEYRNPALGGRVPRMFLF